MEFVMLLLGVSFGSVSIFIILDHKHFVEVLHLKGEVNDLKRSNQYLQEQNKNLRSKW